MRKHMSKIFILGLLASPVTAETVTCEDSVVSVNGPQLELVVSTCEAVKRAEALFAHCNVPLLSNPVEINIVEVVEPGCVAQFHCGEGTIDVLALSQMREKRDANGAFGFLPIEEFYESVIVHELAHAAFDKVPCPLETCLATNEYVAYAMQVKSLSPTARSSFTANSTFDRRITIGEINATLLLIAPDVFKRKVWAHLSQQDDRCGFIGEISSGAVFFDYDIP